MPRRTPKKPMRGGARKFSRGPGFRRLPRGCRLCREKIEKIDYKDVGLLQKYVSERGKIVPSRISGNCASHQRQVCMAIRRARTMALLPFVGE